MNVSQVPHVTTMLVLVFLFSACAENKPDEAGEKTEAKIQKDQTREKTGKKSRDYYLEAGKEIAGKTQSVLGKNLKAQLAEGGVEKAIAYCNIHAMPLTDSLSQVYNARVRRASHKARNPGNKADEKEMKVIKSYISTIEEGKDPKAIVELNDEGAVFYAPIRAKALCLNCHGEAGKSMAEENYKIIKEHYPNDEAIGFQTGDLRGIWSIQIHSKSKYLK